MLLSNFGANPPVLLTSSYLTGLSYFFLISAYFFSL